MRRVGAHEVRLPDGTTLRRAVVEIEQGRVVNYYEFTDELPMTEWLGGVLTIERSDEGILVCRQGDRRVKSEERRNHS